MKYTAEYLNKDDQIILELLLDKLAKAGIERIVVCEEIDRTNFIGQSTFKNVLEFIDGGAEEFALECYRTTKCEDGGEDLIGDDDDYFGAIYCVLGNEDYSTIYDHSDKPEVEKLVSEIYEEVEKLQ